MPYHIIQGRYNILIPAVPLPLAACFKILSLNVLGLFKKIVPIVNVHLIDSHICPFVAVYSFLHLQSSNRGQAGYFSLRAEPYNDAFRKNLSPRMMLPSSKENILNPVLGT